MSSADKARLRRAALVEFGASLEDRLDSLDASIFKASGGKDALRAFAQNLLELIKAAKAELMPDGATADQAETTKVVLRWLDRAYHGTINAAEREGNLELMALGQKRELESVHTLLGKAAAVEEAVAAAAERAVSAALSGGREPGTAPPTLKQQREAEDALEAAQAAVAAPEAQTSPVGPAKGPARTPVTRQKRQTRKGTDNAAHA